MMIKERKQTSISLNQGLLVTPLTPLFQKGRRNPLSTISPNHPKDCRQTLDFEQSPYLPFFFSKGERREKGGLVPSPSPPTTGNFWR
jgi:hypothetical protein